MDDPLGDYLRWLHAGGVAFEVSPDLWRDADHDGPLIPDAREVVPLEIEGLAPFVEHRRPDLGLAANHATFSLLRSVLHARLIPQSGRVWDIGCGTGVLGVAAGLAGARVVIATDVDPEVIEMAKRTAAEAGVPVRFHLGAGLTPVPAGATADFVFANLPHTPARAGAHLPVALAAGENGMAVHGPFVAAARARLAPGATVCFLLHSLPDRGLLRAYNDGFRLTLLSWKRRFLGDGDPASNDHAVERAGRGDSFLGAAGSRRFLVAGAWQAVRW
ncbi:MAG: 50S ribosomal protein L11 methyltransferase [Planctomycetota bacterium]|nr:50S ribosomal protein L11 methyltransferase [Planctomycetota bacterium]